MKKTTKLAIKKVTLKNLDDPTLNQMAGGSVIGATCPDCITKIGNTCPINTCK